jgi:hypothetical protein
MPVILYDARSRGAEAYLALAREMLERATAAAPDAGTETAEPTTASTTNS